MYDEKCSLNDSINNIKNQFGTQSELVIRNQIIGHDSIPETTIIYINGLVNKDMYDIKQNDFRGRRNE